MLLDLQCYNQLQNQNLWTMFFNILFPLSVRKRWQYQIPIVFQVAVRSVHEPADLKMSSEDLVDSLTEKDSRSSYSSPNVADEDLRKCQLKTHHLMCAVVGIECFCSNISFKFPLYQYLIFQCLKIIIILSYFHYFGQRTFTFHIQ